MTTDVVDLAIKSGAAYTTEGNRVLYVMSATELQKFFNAARQMTIGQIAMNESQVLALWKQSEGHVLRFAKLVEYFYGGGHV
jgi:hypothetical protein